MSRSDIVCAPESELKIETIENGAIQYDMLRNCDLHVTIINLFLGRSGLKHYIIKSLLTVDMLGKKKTKKQTPFVNSTTE